uniref:Protein draper-like n=1 Tax=Crassostrea virginica TaxID=6565 RepID=A0A8B8AQJ9_CRAVI|nr:protein draper-like [Crassostrea virginica]
MACAIGYFGSHCSSTCPPGLYGDQCAGLCFPNCSNTTCHHVFGCLESNIKTGSSKTSGEYPVSIGTTTQDTASKPMNQSIHLVYELDTISFSRSN